MSRREELTPDQLENVAGGNILDDISAWISENKDNLLQDVVENEVPRLYNRLILSLGVAGSVLPDLDTFKQMLENAGVKIS